MMEIAKNVRDFLVGMKDTLSQEEETLLANVQDLHEQYLAIMDDFSVQVSTLALSMRPEARMMSHQLRLRLYQDWRAKLMERIFASSPLSSSPPMCKISPPSTSTIVDGKPFRHRAGCEEGTCTCELTARLDTYKQVINQYLEASTKYKSKRSTASSPDLVSKQLCDSDVPESDDDEYIFEFPEFLGIAPLRDRLHS